MTCWGGSARVALRTCNVAPSGEQLGGDVLGVRFERRGSIARQWHLAGEEFVDAPAQRRPVVLGDLEV